MKGALAVLLLIGLVTSGAAESAHAHTRSVSYSSWDLAPEGARVRVRISLLELSRLPPALHKGDPGTYLAEHLTLLDGGRPCDRGGSPQRLRSAEGWAQFEWHLTCAAGPRDRTIESEVLLEVAPSHLHFARVRSQGEPVVERVLTSTAPSFRLGSSTESDSAASGTTLGGYVRLGVEHILTGWDHLAFVLGLLLLAGTLRELAGLVTSFTVAHSITLGLAVLGWVHPDGAAVEALIGYSIALVAAENGWILSGRGRSVPWVATLALVALAVFALGGIGTVSAATLAGTAVFTASHFGLLRRAERPARLRAAVAFAFGLVHGFGFAGVLAEMELPTERLVPALFGFNVGVELGQLALVAIAWPLLRGLARLDDGRRYRVIAEVGSAAICGLGVFWFASRALG